MGIRKVDVIHYDDESVIISGLENNTKIISSNIPGIYKGMKIKTSNCEENNFLFCKISQSSKHFSYVFIVFGISGVINLKSSFFPLITLNSFLQMRFILELHRKK